MKAEDGPWDISAIVPVFNGSQTLAPCLESLAQQGKALREIIVVDDASGDSSPDIVRSFAARDARVTLVQHQENQGLARTLNDGIARATGNAVLILQQDCELVGGDWVERSLGFLRQNYPCCLSANPRYPFPEMSPVDVAFGLLRDHFSPMEREREELGFSEFKCDLIPRAALGEIPFDPRFRISGEDQVLSEGLWRAGFSIIRFQGLDYVQRSGNTSSLGSQLRKEVGYGKTEGGILLRTALRIVPRSSRSRASRRRLWNRASEVAFAVGIVSLCLLLGLRAGWGLLIPPLLLAGLRTSLLVLRSQPLLRGQLIAPRSLGLALAVAPLADLAYVGAVVSGVFAFLVAKSV